MDCSEPLPKIYFPRELHYLASLSHFCLSTDFQDSLGDRNRFVVVGTVSNASSKFSLTRAPIFDLTVHSLAQLIHRCVKMSDQESVEPIHHTNPRMLRHHGTDWLK